jgi:hypothetical protein
MFGAIAVGVERIAVAGQRADAEAVVGQLLFEVVELGFVIEHGELAVRIARIIAGTEFHGIDVVAFQLLEHVLEGKLRQQGSEDTDSHVRSPCMG